MGDINDLFAEVDDAMLAEAVQAYEQELAYKNTEEYKQYHVKSAETIVPNVNGKTVQELMGLTSLHERVRMWHHAIKHDAYDLYHFEDIVAVSQTLPDVLAEGESVLPTFKYLIEDLFLSLFLREARFNAVENMHKSVQINYVLLQRLLNTENFINLRKACIGNAPVASVAADILADDALEIYKEMLNNISDLDKKKEQLDELIEQEENIDEIVDAIEKIGEQIAQEIKSDTPNEDKLQEYSNAVNNATMTLEEAKEIANSMAEQCDELISDDAIEEMPQMETIPNDIANAIPEVTEVKELVERYGITDSDGRLRIPLSHAIPQTERLRRSRKARNWINEIGRSQDAAYTEQKKKAKYGQVEISSVTTGDSIQDALPSEKMNLIRDTTKMDFYRRYSEKSLLIFDKKSNKEKNKGPIIVCVDTSGSMRGEKEKWSKAFTAGVIEVAQFQKRDFACILYDTKAEEPIIISKGEIAPAKILDCIEIFLGGGTNFERPLEEAMKLISKSQFQEADILFVTDGSSSVSDSFLTRYKKVKEDKEFRTKGIVVDIDGYCTDSSMKEFCDDIVTVSSMADLDADSEVNRAIYGSL